LHSGEKAPLTSKELAIRMSKPEVANIVQKPRELPVEELTAVTRFSDNGYSHLMRTVTEPKVRRYIAAFMDATAKWINPSTVLKSHESPVV